MLDLALPSVGTGDLRVYARCYAGGPGVAIAFANRSPSKTFALDVHVATAEEPNVSTRVEPRREWHLARVNRTTPWDRHVQLNGVPLEMTGDQVPDLTSLAVENPGSSALVVAPFTVGFAVVNLHASLLPSVCA